VTEYFLDTSALAKRYINETGSNWIRSLVNPTGGNILTICDLTPIELFSLIERRLREKRLNLATAKTLQTGFLKHYQKEYISVILEQPILIHARDLVTKYPLRPPDAIQLACAIEARTTLGVPITFLCADNDLLSAALAEGFTVDNPNLHP
jgi:predicted nucleic acid-binding protein